MPAGRSSPRPEAGVKGVVVTDGRMVAWGRPTWRVTSLRHGGGARHRTLAQRLFVAPPTFEMIGKVLLGVEPDGFML